MPSKSCPPRSVLADFAIGRLDMAGIDDVSRHLETCSECSDKLGTLQVRDSLLDAIRTPAGGESPSDPALSELISRLQSYAQTVNSEAENIPLSDRLACLRPAQSPDEIGRLGRYRVLQVVGVGGMGTVFLAEDTQVEGSSRPRTVALKVMRPGMSEGSKGRKRFLREVQTLVAQDHPAIVPVLDVGEDNGVPYFAMPLLRGESLDARLRREGILPIAETIAIAHEIASGLAAAHERGVIHRDVKPANVFLCRSDDQSRPVAPRPENPESSNPSQEDAPSDISETTAFRSRSDRSTSGSVKLMDFGLARTVEQTSWQTQAGTVLGTPHYMAPEQIEGRDLDPRADLFSLGCVLFRMTTGTLPFTGPSHMSVFVSVTRDTPPNVRHLNPAVPPALAELIEQLLEKQPDRRPRSAAEVAERLTAIGNGDNDVSDPATPLSSQEFVTDVPSGTTVMIRPARIRKTVLGIVTVLALVTALVAWKSRPQIAGQNNNPALVSKSVAANPPAVAEPAVRPAVWEIGPNDNPLHGLVARPVAMRGVKHWQLETLQPRGELREFQWSPDGKWLAVANARQLRVYEFAEGELQLKRILSDGSEIFSMSWSPDSERVVVSYRQDDFPTIGLRVWNVRTGTAEQSAPLPEYWNAKLAWSPDGKWLLSVGPIAGGPGKVSLYRMPELVFDRELANIDKVLNCACWSPDSLTVVAGGAQDPIVRLWKLDGTMTSHNVASENFVSAVSWSPDGKWLAAGIVVSGNLSTVQLLSPNGERGPTLEGPHSQLFSLAWSPDSQRLMAASYNVVLWDNLYEPRPRRLTPTDGVRGEFVGSWHPQGRFIVFGQQSICRMWLHDDSEKTIRVVTEPQPLACFPSVSQNNHRLAFGASDGSVRARQDDGSLRVVIQHRLLAASEPSAPFEKWHWGAGGSAGPSLAWTKSGRELASQHRWHDAYLRVWSAAQPTAPTRSIPVGASPYNRLQARGEQMVRFDGGLHELDLLTGEVTQKWTPQTPEAFTVSFDGELAVIVDAGWCKVLRLSDGSTVSEFKSGVAIDSHALMSWTQDSRFLVINGQANYELWNARTWQRVWTAPIANYSLASSAPDGHAIATAYGIADFETGKLRHRFQHPGNGFAWYPDSQRFASVTDYLTAIHSAKDGSIQQTIVPIAPDHTFAFDPAGNLRQGDAYVFEKEFVCLVEHDDGTRDVMRPSELLKLAGLSAWPTAESLTIRLFDSQSPSKP